MTLRCYTCHREIRPGDRFINWGGQYASCQPCALQAGHHYEKFMRISSVRSTPRPA